MALSVCAWCGQVLKQGTGPISHGICKRCAEKLLSDHRANLPRFLELFEEPIVVVDDDVRALAANLPLQRMVGKGVAEIEGKLGGQIFTCANALLPGGCGKSGQCTSCVIRSSVVKTYNTGESVVDAPALLTQPNGNVVMLRVTTEKMGDAVLLRVSAPER